MRQNDSIHALLSMREDLAAIEHERWSHWQRYMHSKGMRQPDGSLLLPADLIAQWERQMSQPYAELSESEKQSDREQVDRYMGPILVRLRTAS